MDSFVAKRQCSPRSTTNTAKSAVQYPQDPDFDTMVYRSPEVMQELNSLLQGKVEKPDSSKRLKQIKSSEDCVVNNDKIPSLPINKLPRPSSPLLKSTNAATKYPALLPIETPLPAHMLPIQFKYGELIVIVLHE